MAVTKIYKETGGFNLMVDDGTNHVSIGYPLLYINGTNVIIRDAVAEVSYTIPIADVRDFANAAIGGQTEDEVRIYIDAEMGK